jgi:hypothetical protein
MPAFRARLGVPAASAVMGAALLLTAAPAAADHTNPATPLSPLTPPKLGTAVRSEGPWTFVKNFPMNPGTDVKTFTRDGVIYAAAGTLGQNDELSVGQRIVRLTGEGAPAWVADHGSANCSATVTTASGTLGLQHDTVVTPPADAELMIDTTDAAGRCHDTSAGGLEIVDISGVGRQGGAPVKEIHLVRLDGTSHTATLDATRPWLVYNSNSDGNRHWIDVLDIRSCLGLVGRSLADKQAACRPAVYRMPFDATWTSRLDPADNTLKSPSGCHDITARPGRLYCAAIHGTVVLDVTNLTDGNGDVRGAPLPCTVVDGTATAAKVSDCRVTATQWEQAGKPAATGFSHVTHVNHPGTNGNNNQTAVRSDEGVSISHEADPTPDGRFMFVTDERGGGVVPPGSTCAPGPDNPIGNGGMHVYDISNPAQPKYATMPDGKKAVFISHNVLPEPTFCNIHVIEQIPDEARLVMAWYSQGIKVVDYKTDDKGAWTFTEVGFLTLPEAQTWTAEPFRVVSNPDGTRTYHVVTSDIGRGIDVVTFTAKPNLLPAVRGGGATPRPNPNADTNAQTRVAGTQESRGAAATGTLAATGEDTRAAAGLAVVLLGVVLALRVVLFRPAAARPRGTPGRATGER